MYRTPFKRRKRPHRLLPCLASPSARALLCLRARGWRSALWACVSCATSQATARSCCPSRRTSTRCVVGTHTRRIAEHTFWQTWRFLTHRYSTPSCAGLCYSRRCTRSTRRRRPSDAFCWCPTTTRHLSPLRRRQSRSNRTLPLNLGSTSATYPAYVSEAAVPPCRHAAMPAPPRTTACGSAAFSVCSVLWQCSSIGTGGAHQ